ncbi:putative mitochondrial protein [Cucumis melo var. makuwa]|uniref:Mitochondrial protein n=1 Tax=Cucumis melo var. makuwa TaxID=1194695 RepID=A0A5A7UGZ3_CUCMM|nr:putative mitochondrial protein [Cucumis melo var. makuwa]
MGLRPEYESVRAALLHRSPLPLLDATIQEILFEEKRLGINLSKHSNVVLASTYSPPGASSTFVRIVSSLVINLLTRYCHKPGHILDNCPIKPPRPQSYSTRAKNFTKPMNSSVVAATSDNPTTPQFQISDLQSLLNQLISSSSSALAISPSNRWLLNSACCNHMTSNYSLMNTPSPAKSLPPIYAADGNYMNITHIGTVQDPQTEQTIGTGRKVRRLFELLSLQVPSPSSISTPVTDSDTYQWHLRLGHASPENLRHLISINHLNSTTKFVPFNCLNCKLAKQPALSFSTSTSISDKPFDLIHSDIWGPAPTSTGNLVQRSCPHTSQQNGRVERKHRQILDSVRGLLLSASCPEKFWGEAALTYVYTINHLPSSVLQNISPFEKLYGNPLNYSNLKTFGCACFVLLHPHEHTKLEPRVHLYYFLGYGTEHKGFHCWDPLSNRLRISRHVTFWEHTMFSRLSSFHTSFSSPQPFFTDTPIDLFPLSESPLGNELAQSAPTSATSDQSFISDGSSEPTPDTPPYHSTRARLVAKGYSQEYGIDYEETFAHVARMTSVRSLLVVAAAKQWPLLQINVKNAFLNGTFSEEVYMKPPPGYCFYLGDSLISWRSKKQIVVSRSITESEYRALADTTAKLLWLRWLLTDMGVPQQSPTLLHCDNRSDIQIAYNDVFHERTKHIENDCHFIRHHLLSNTLFLQPVSTTEQPADIFTKALPSTRFNQLCTKLKLTATLPP